MFELLLIQRNFRMPAPQKINCFVFCNNSEIRPCFLSVKLINFFKMIGDIKKGVLNDVLCIL